MNKFSQEQPAVSRPAASFFSGKKLLGILVLAGLGMLFLIMVKTARTVDVITIGDTVFDSSTTATFSQDAGKLHRDPDRINILLLGIRGENDPHGGLLADMIMLVSIRKDDGRIALVSIPRDLYVDIPKHPQKERINFAYVKGEELARGGGGVLLEKKVVSEVTGVYIDYGASLDFTAFKEAVDELGGIDVYVPADFRESTQWTYEFFIPQGWNHMDADTALYYVRSRYSTSDFDRARRQQDMLLAMKDKIFSLGILANPVKISSFLDIIGKHIKTDADSAIIKDLIRLNSKKELHVVTRKVFDSSQEGFLYSTTVNGAYVLLPREENFNNIQNFIIHIFDSSK